MENDLLDLDTLSIKLQAISDELKKSEDVKRIEKLASEILELMKHRTDYYYQFSHGGEATGFNWFSSELINTWSTGIVLSKWHEILVYIRAE